MRIAVNTRLLLKNKLEGIGWFAYESLKRITTQHPEHEFIFIFDRPFDSDFVFGDNVKAIKTGLPARHPFLFYLWFEHALPAVFQKYKPKLFLSPDGYLSLNTSIKQLPVIHDLNFAQYPKDLPFLMSKYYNFYFPLFAKKAHRIATVSEFSKKDIHERYGIDLQKIDVVYNGANDQFKPINESEKTQTKLKHSFGCDYFLFVGSLHPRKNLKNLFLAFDAYKQKEGGNVKLLIVGEKYYWPSDLENTFNQMKHKNDVIFVGRMYHDELNKIIASSLAMAYVSYYEGFGIPIVEAFYCETPVITSNVTAMPETAGNAALLVDPFSVNSIADALSNIAGNKMLRDELVANGIARKNEYTWQKTADNLWLSIEKCF